MILYIQWIPRKPKAHQLNTQKNGGVKENNIKVKESRVINLKMDRMRLKKNMPPRGRIQMQKIRTGLDERRLCYIIDVYLQLILL